MKNLAIALAASSFLVLAACDEREEPVAAPAAEVEEDAGLYDTPTNEELDLGEPLRENEVQP